MKMNRADAVRLIPPRPIPDPLPWPEPSSGGILPTLTAFAFVALIGLLIAFVLLRKRRVAESPITVPPPTTDGPIARADRIRSALVARFGESWSARTTEEIALDQPLLERLGPERTEILVEYLRRADRIKFATSDPTTISDADDRDESRLIEILALLAAD